MNIDWAALFKVAAVSFAFGVGIVAVFSVGLLGLSQLPAGGMQADQRDGQNTADQRDGQNAAGKALAGACFALCAAAVLYGLWLIVPQFH